MKLFILWVVMLIAPLYSRADCQIASSQQKVTWNKISPSERQQAKGEDISLPEKRITVQVACSQPQRIRLFLSSNDIQTGSAFGLGTGGTMNVIASDAYVDGKPVRLISVRSDSEVLTAEGVKETEVYVNQGLAFTDDKEVSGSSASVAFTVTGKIKPGAITESTTWRGNMSVRMEVQ